MWQRANGKTLGFLSARSLSRSAIMNERFPVSLFEPRFPVYLKVVHRRSDAPIELDARLSTPILTMDIAVSDA